MLVLFKSKAEFGNGMPSLEEHPPTEMVGHPHPQALAKIKPLPKVSVSSGVKKKKTDIKQPGKRGGKWYRDKEGGIRYGTPPKGHLPAAPPEHAHHWPGGVMHKVPLPAHVPDTEHTDGQQHHMAAAIGALRTNQKINPIRLPKNEDEHRQDVLNRLGIDHNSKAAQTRKLPAAPTTAMKWAQQPELVEKMFNDLRPEVREAAIEGLQHVERNMHLARRGALTGRSVLMHFAWAILSRSAEPYAQESAYIDLEHSGLGRFVDKAQNGTFNIEEFNKWVHDPMNPVLVLDAVKKGYKKMPEGLDPQKKAALSQDSPGKAVTTNVNAIGKMLERWNGKTKGLTELFTDPHTSGQEARRQFWAKGYGGGGLGINNKILSFTIGMLGKPDVMVMDIWQARKYHPEAYAKNLAEGAAKKSGGKTPEERAAAEQEESDLRDHLALAADAHETEGTKDTEKALGEARHRLAKHQEKQNKGNLAEATTKLTDPYGRPGGPVGLAAYESIEDLLHEAIKGLPTDEQGLVGGKITPSVFALHWLSWVSNFDSTVKHSSLDTPLELDEQGLSSRPQAETSADAPSASDRLNEQAQTMVEQGNPKNSTFGSTYQRGDVTPSKLETQAYLGQNELAPGTKGQADEFSNWFNEQPADVRSHYTTMASQHLEPVMRELATAHGLALSVDENFGGYDGKGNGVSQALMVSLPKQNPDGSTSKMLPEEQEQAVANYARHLGWALKQDMSVYGRVAESWDEPGVKPAFDFQLTRRLTPEENDKLAKSFHTSAVGDSGVDSGYSMLNNNTIRAINFAGKLTDDQYRNKLVQAFERVDPSLLAVGNDNNYLVRKLPYKSEAINNEWNNAEPPRTTTATEGDNGNRVQPRGTTNNDPSGVASKLRQSLELFNRDFLDHNQRAAKSFLSFSKQFFLKSAGGDQWKEEKRDQKGKWTADYSGMSPEGAKHLEAALHHAHERYADMSGLVVGPQHKVSKEGDSAPTSHLMTTYSGAGGPRAIGYAPADTSDHETTKKVLAGLNEHGHVTIKDAQGLAHHEVGHVVRRKNPAGSAVQRSILTKMADALRSGKLTEDDVHKAIGTYGQSNSEEMFAELYRLEETGGLPDKLKFLSPEFEKLNQAYTKGTKFEGEAVTLPSATGKSLLERLDEGLNAPTEKESRARTQQNITIKKARAKEINPLLGEFSSQPMTPETEKLRYSKLKPEQQRKYDEIDAKYAKQIS